MIKKLMVITIVLLLSSCVAQWERVSVKNNNITQNGLNLHLPDNWVTLKVSKTFQLTSLDGPSLNQISLETLKLKDLEKELKIKIPENLDALDASKQYLAYWSSKSGISEFDIVSNQYIELNSQPYYKVEWTFKDSNGMTVRNISQGFARNGSLTHVFYSAPSIHYFNKSLATFENVCNNLTHI